MDHAIDPNLSNLPEDEFPIFCAGCKYNLTGLGEEGRCPECATPFIRYDRLHEIYSAKLQEIDPGLDHSYDISHISEARFPITCLGCGHSLRKLGNAGHCPKCSLEFDRRRRLWDIYGPEAFAWQPPPPKTMGMMSALGYAALTAIVFMVLLSNPVATCLVLLLIFSIRAVYKHFAGSTINAERHYEKRMKEFSREKPQPGSIILFGSSHLEWFNTDQFLPDYQFTNRGIASDRLDVDGRGLLHRLDISVFDCQPSMLILQNGINDLGELARNGEPALQQIFASYEAVVATIRKQMPDLPICLINEMPTTGQFACCVPFVPTFNQHIRTVADKFNCLHVDIYSQVVAPNGKLLEELTYDGLHLNETGYSILAECLKDVLPTIDEECS